MNKTPDNINSILNQRKSFKPHPDNEYRTIFEVDAHRILFSDPFRRLQAKTQVLQLSESDFHRTRLTHSVEVASIAKSIFKKINTEISLPNEIKFDLALPEAIGYAHDLGHPPFGHGGEIALNYMMHEHGGFEGNGQTLRILAKLCKYSENNGMDLTRRTLLGILKYPCSFTQVNKSTSSHCEKISFHTLNRQIWTPPKCYFDCEQEIVDWILEPFSIKDKTLFTKNISKKNEHSKSLFKSFDCSIMDLADDIAYAMHDFEDAHELGLIDKDHINKLIEELQKDDLLKSYLINHRNENIEKFIKYFSSLKIKHAISILIGYFIYKSEQVLTSHEFESEHLRYNIKLPNEAHRTLGVFKDLIKENIINSPETKRIEKKGQILICYLFDALANDTKLMPISTQKKYDDAEDHLKYRIVCDYISGMTDDYAIKTYKKIFGQDSISYFEK